MSREKIRVRTGDSVRIHGAKMEVGDPVSMVTLSGSTHEVGTAMPGGRILFHSDAELVTRKLARSILSGRDLRRALRPGNAIDVKGDEKPRLIVAVHNTMGVRVWPAPVQDVPQSPYRIVFPQLRIDGQVKVSSFTHRDGGPPVEGEPATFRLDYQSWPTLSYGVDGRFVEISVPLMRRDRVWRIPWKQILSLPIWFCQLTGEEPPVLLDALDQLHIPWHPELRWPNDEGIVSGHPCRRCLAEGWSTLLMRVGVEEVVCLACDRRYRNVIGRGDSLPASMLYLSQCSDD